MLRPHVPITTERLMLRPFTFNDAETVFRWHRNPDVTRYTGGQQNREQSFVSLARWIHRFHTQGWGPLAVQAQGMAQPMGWCGLQPLPATRDFELFYGYATEGWGQGYATEAARALLRVGFMALPVDRIVARVQAENLASQHVVTKLGMRKLPPVFNDIYGGMVDFFALAQGQQP